MSSIVFEVLVIILLILANGLFAMSEIAIVSARKARLQQLANEGNQKARTALELANSPNRFLSTVQVGITLVGVLAGAFGGARIASKLAGPLSQIPGLAPYSNLLGLGIVVVAITYFTLIIGELVPKRIALNHPERIATMVAQPMKTLAAIAAPVVHLLSFSMEGVLRLLRVKSPSQPSVTEEEIKVLIDQGTEAGTFEVAEKEIVQRVFRLGDRQVNSLMTPRPEIVWLDLNDAADKSRHKVLNSTHSRFPVCRGHLDEVLGVAHVKDLIALSLSTQSFELTESLQTPLFVPESMKAFNALELFKRSDTPHTALVVDEYGVIQGLVTVNDILEAIVGDIPSVEEFVEPLAIQRQDGSWLLDGMLLIEALYELFQLRLPPDPQSEYRTLAGFVIDQLGQIPRSADHFEWQGLRFEVVDMDGNRVDKVLVMPAPVRS